MNANDERCPFCSAPATETCRLCGGLFCRDHLADPDHVAIDDEYGFTRNPIFPEEERNAD